MPHDPVTIGPRAQGIAYGVGKVGKLNGMITRGAFSWVHPHPVSFQPTSLGSGGIGSPSKTIPLDGSPVNACR